jgi:hypothetical protein
MENVQNEESPSLTKFYDELVFSSMGVQEANMARMSDAQLISFYEYCIEKSEVAELDGAEFYWYSSLLLEDKPAIKLYKEGQLYVDVTVGEESVPFMEEVEVTEEDLADIERTISLLEQRKKDKKNPIKKLIRFFKS